MTGRSGYSFNYHGCNCRSPARVWQLLAAGVGGIFFQSFQRGMKSIETSYTLSRIKSVLGIPRILADSFLKVDTYEGTSPYHKSWGQVPLCELAIFASNSSCKFGPCY